MPRRDKKKGKKGEDFAAAAAAPLTEWEIQRRIMDGEEVPDAPAREMSEEEIAKKIMDGELPPDYSPPKVKRALSEEEIQQKIMDGELDPHAVDVEVKVSKSAWRKQKGEFSKKDADTAARILDGELPDDMAGMSVSGGGEDDEAEMMRKIMDGDVP